jgi:Protein of unknown function (DUF2637)
MTTQKFDGIDPGLAVLLHDRQQVNGSSAHVDRTNGTVAHTVDIRPHRGWFQSRERTRTRRPAGDGSAMISTALFLLSVLAVGLFGVSYAAQYRYVLSQRHQVDASLIEAGALDLTLCVLSLLALGLSRAGKRSTVERWGVIFAACLSSAMNYAAANGGDWRSVLAWTMPPLVLAFLVDRTVSVIRRHVLRMEDTGSPFLAGARVVGTVAKAIGILGLYVLRLFLAPIETPKGLRRMVLNATPLPEAPAPIVVRVISAERKTGEKPKAIGQGKTGPRGPRSDSKATKLVAAAEARYGPLALLALDQVSPACKELASEVGMDAGWARTVLRKAVLAAHKAVLAAHKAEEEAK